MKKLLVFVVVFALGFAQAATTAEIDAAVARALAFLRAAQAADGHYSDSNTPALTALPLWAFSAAGEAGSEPAARAARFVLASQNADGGFCSQRPAKGGAGKKRPANDAKHGEGDGSGGPGGLSTYNTAVCLSALFESGLSPAEPLLKARTFLAQCQLEGEDSMAGGFGYSRAVGRRRYADLSNTAYAMDAMRRTESLEEFRKGGQRADLNWDEALKFVENLQSQEGPERGGAAYNERTPQAGTATNASGRVRLMAYGSMSYAAVLSMCHARLTRGDPRVRNALEYCERNWTLEENPGMGSQGLYYYFDILSRALSAAKVDKVGDHAWRQELADRVLALQKADGSWYNDNNRFWEADPVLVTSFAVLALELCR